MNILDIDIDFFLDRKCDNPAKVGKRLPADDYHVWKEKDVRSFVENQCRLTKTNRIKGRIAERHDALFDTVNELEYSNIQLFHVDAHHDLYCKNMVWVMEELVTIPVEKRVKKVLENRNMLDEGNVVAFLLACRKLSHFFFITNTKRQWHERYRIYSENFNEHSPHLQVPTIKPGQKWDKMVGYDLNLEKVNWVEPQIPIEIIDYNDWKAEDIKFDFVFVCRSPEYTPEESDSLIPFFREYIYDDPN